MKVYTVTETIDYGRSSILGVYATAVRAKETCWQAAEGWAQPDESIESTEDGVRLSIKISGVRFHVDEHEVVGA